MNSSAGAADRSLDFTQPIAASGANVTMQGDRKRTSQPLSVEVARSIGGFSLARDHHPRHRVPGLSSALTCASATMSSATCSTSRAEHPAQNTPRARAAARPRARASAPQSP